ncbi:MAG: hypothetical protein JST92_07020, partial [Deltaproteobacteria bacterium]|nr:hypothetical protein [Deltaproteobacteria bacterium]
MTTTLRIASLTCALTCIALTACQINDTGGVYACTDDGDCAGHGGGSRCLPTGDGGIPADAGPSCGVGLSVCDGQCVLLSSDPHHCGACGTACGDGQACISGACADDATPTITAHLDSPALTKDGFASFHVTSCSGIASVFVSSSTSTPASDAAFTQCTTSGLSSALTEGANTIAIWAKSAGGTVSTSPATLAVTKDSTAPVLTLTGLADGATVGSDQFLPVTLTIADVSPIASARVELSADQGSTWIAGLIAGATTSTSIAGTVYLPASSTTWQVRLVGTDVLGNTSTQARGTLNALVCDPSGAPFGGGLGGPAHPYRICSNAQLLAAQGHATDDFRLEADLDLAGAALRLGNRNDSTFDGNGHAIAHYTISTPAGAANYVTGVGLFDLLTNATIKNLSVVVDSISGHDARGVGGVVGDTDQSSVIEDVDVTIGSTISGVAGVGGAIGRLKGLANRVRVHGSGSTGSNVVCESADGALDPFKGVIGGVIGEHEGTAIALSANALNVTCDAPASDSGSTGGLIGFLAGGASASDLSGTNLTVSAAQFAGGLIGESDDAVNNAMLQASFVNCLGDTPASGANAGGLIGFLSGALTNGTVSGVRVNCGNPNGNGVGGLVGNSAPGASLVNGSVQGGAVIGHINVGGAVGYSSGSVTSVRTTGLTVVSGLTAIGGVIGHADTTSGPLTQLGSDAYLFESDFVDVNLGGLIGQLSVAGTSSIAISQCASHAHFGSPGATGSLLGSISFNTSGPVQGAVSFTDCYGDTAPAILAANVSSGGLIGYVAPSGTLRLTRVFEFARAPDNACIAGLEQNPPPPFTYTNVSWNTDRCAQSSTPVGATGLAESAFAQTSTFTGYDFTGTWAMGGNHPKLRWEPPELAGSGGVQPNGAVGFFDAHPTIGADLIIPISITATGFGGVDLAQVEYSSDGVRWFTGSSIGPYAGGTQTNVSFYAPAVIGEYTVRLRVVAHDGTTMVKPAGTFLAVECSPTARPFGGGRGNDDKPYRICDPNQLMAVTSTINSSFRMYSDVDVTGFTPVLGGKFRGYFDGAGFTIKHFSAVRAASSTAPLRFGWGLFNGVGGINGQNQVGNGSVTNLTIQVDAIDGQDTNSVGALVGNVNQGGSVTHSHVIMTGHLTGSGATGGAIGFVNQQAGLVTDITVDGGGTVACSTSTKTGPIGYAFGGVIGNSSGASSGLHASGITVTCAYPQTSAVGGVVGAASGAAFDDFSASGVTIQAYNQLGGAAGSLGEGTFTRVTSTGATVTCLGSGDDNNPDFANAGGAVGNVWSQATTTTVDRVSSFGSSVSCPNSRFIGVTVGNMGSGSNGAVGVSISHGLTSGGRADGQSEVGGFIGGMGNGGALATTQVVGSPSVRGVNTAGGVAGGLYGGTITQVSTDAFVQGDTSQLNHGGVVGGMNAYL